MEAGIVNTVEPSISQQKEPEVKEESVKTSESIRFVNQNQIGQDNSEPSEISKGCKIWF